MINELTKMKNLTVIAVPKPTTFGWLAYGWLGVIGEDERS